MRKTLDVQRSTSDAKLRKKPDVQKSASDVKRKKPDEQRNASDDKARRAEECKRRQEEEARRAEECKQRQEEEARRAEERKKREEEEHYMRMQQMKAQLDALTSLSSGDSSSGILATASTGRVAESTDRLKLTKLTESDDVEAYLTTFERMMAVHKIKEDCWAIKLAPQLTGKALLAYAAMGAEAASNNLEVKKAILKRFGIN